MKVWSQKNLEDIRHEYIDFDGEWYLAFGRPEKSGCWIIYGKSGQGKVLSLCSWHANLMKWGFVFFI